MKERKKAWKRNIEEVLKEDQLNKLIVKTE